VGTASLVSGIMLVLIGFATIGQALLANYFTLEQFFDSLAFNIIIGLPFIIVGALLLRKYDRDKKKEKEPIQNNVPEKEVELVKESEWSPKKSPTVKGIFIGVIVVSIIFGGMYLILSQSFVVSTSGMEPELQIYDLIRYNEVPFNEIQIGDIIAYYSPSEQDKVIVHRVAEITNEDPLTIRTKGDARPTSIPGMDFPITEDEYIGRIDTIVPGGGQISRVFVAPFNIIILIAAFVIPIVIMKIREQKKKI